MEHRRQNGPDRPNGERGRDGIRRPMDFSDAAAEGQRSSFYERAARRMGERAESTREWHEQHRRDRERAERERESAHTSGEEAPLPAGGGFGQGGYGSYGEQGREARGGEWGNERVTFGGEERRQQREFGRRRWQREVMTAGEIMTARVRCVSPETALDEVAGVMREENVGVVPVIDARRRLVGMVTDRDLVVRAAADGRGFSSTHVSEVMTDEVDAVTADEPVPAVIELMGKRQVRRVPVVDRDDRLVGIIAMADIATRADFDEELQDALQRVSSRRSFWSRVF
jgi:CBS domain-containing protein